MSWPQDFPTNFQFLLRWLHFLGGITWIGMLYFFNLVNVQFQKEIDAPTKLKINPPLLSRALFWFRWGAVVTWVTGFLYYFLIANTEIPGHRVLGIFVIGWIVAFVVEAGLLRVSIKGGALKNGGTLGVVIAIWMTIVSAVLAYYGREWGASSRLLSILIGGGLGTVMFMNVWMIIWPLQRRIIAATVAAGTGTPTPAEQPLWARRSFLASRTNTWLSVPMLFFMGAASHFPIFNTVVK